MEGYKSKAKRFIFFKRCVLLHIKDLKTKSIKDILNSFTIQLENTRHMKFVVLWKNQGNKLYAWFIIIINLMKIKSLKTKWLAFSFQKWITGIWLQMNGWHDQTSSFISAFLTKRAYILYVWSMRINLRENYQYHEKV